MGMLLYMMELEQQEKEKEKAAAKKVAAKSVPTPDTVSVPEEKKPEVKEKEEKQEAKKPTRVEIMKMNVATIRAYAESQGIEGANAMSGAELKRILVNRLLEEAEAEE